MSDLAKKISQIEKLTFESAMQELEEIVAAMEEGEINLDESIENYEYAMALRKFLEAKLNNAKLKIEKIEN